MDRRKEHRTSRRMGVRFWERGSGDRGHLGYTVNVSEQGMFVGTDQPPKSGSRVRLEITDEEVGFTIEGVVAHSRRVAPELRKIREPGMGVRFLSHAELVGPLIEKMGGAPAGRAAEAASAGEASFPVRFANSWEFLRILERDIAHGGLFVPTSRPPGLNQMVSLELSIPGFPEPIVLPARVVHRFDPAEARPGTGGGRTAGMGVEFVDQDETIHRLQEIAARLRPSGSAGSGYDA